VQCRSRGWRNMILQNWEIWELVSQTNTAALTEQEQRCRSPVSSRAAAARWRGGDGCSLPASHQIGRSTISNISGNSWGLPIHLLRVIGIFSLQWERRSAPPFWERLDQRHCMFRCYPVVCCQPMLRCYLVLLWCRPAELAELSMTAAILKKLSMSA
jgi:hypothetical protein